MNTVYTAGYRAWTPEQLQAKVAALGALLLDIRYSPSSGRAAWRMGALVRLVGSENYAWLIEFGNRNYRTVKPIELVAPGRGVARLREFGWLESRPIILLCACEDFHTCHRLQVADLLQQRFDAPVVHLEPPARPRVIKVLTLCQPFATLVALRLKRWETRPSTISWRNYRGPLAIHAGLSKAWFKRWIAPELIAELEAHGYYRPADYPLGAILAVGEMTASMPTEAARGGLSVREIQAGDYRDGRLAIRIDDVKRLREPVQASGSLGLWEYEWALLEAQLG